MANLSDLPPAELEKLSDQALRLALQKIKAAIPNIEDPHQQGRVIGRAFAVERRLGLVPLWFSQAGQDRWLDTHVFKGKREGVFVEVGAFDGVTGSNTLSFEMFRGWSGILIEPSPKWAAAARANRRLPVLELAAGAEAGMARFFDVEAGYTQMGGLSDSYDPDLRAQVEADQRFKGQEIEVEIRPLDQILSDHGLSQIDYVSLDVEGAEKSILERFPFDDFAITAWSVENNSSSDALSEIMTRAGYARQACIGVDELWVRPDLMP